MKTEFKWGDRVLVKDIDDNIWSERIFLQEIKGSQNPYVTVNGYYEPEFLKGEPFRTVTYAQIKPVEKELPKGWEELPEIKGFYVSEKAEVERLPTHFSCAFKTDRSTFATKEQAEASIAMAQLSQLMKVYNDGWTPDWSDRATEKYVIFYSENKIEVATSLIIHHSLRFKTKELRNKFLLNFRDLIEQAKPLL